MKFQFAREMIRSKRGRRGSMRSLCISLLCCVIGGASLAASAQETSGAAAPRAEENKSEGNAPYEPRMGEQPVYGKKYYPGTPVSGLFLEVNPLLLINRGLSVEFEKRGGDTWTFGADVQYRNANVYDTAGVRGKIQYLAIAPKVRIYPMETMAGVFFGLKVLIGQVAGEVSDVRFKTEHFDYAVSPVAHVGYRFVSSGGFTFAAYLGGGFNIPKPEFEQSQLDPAVRDDARWNAARDKVNESNGLFRPDFGLTLGVAL